jgi:hypothetical protein
MLCKSKNEVLRNKYLDGDPFALASREDLGKNWENHIFADTIPAVKVVTATL